jgi:hypothetical protein
MNLVNAIRLITAMFDVGYFPPNTPPVDQAAIAFVSRAKISTAIQVATKPADSADLARACQDLSTLAAHNGE